MSPWSPALRFRNDGLAIKVGAVDGDAFNEIVLLWGAAPPHLPIAKSEEAQSM